MQIWVFRGFSLLCGASVIDRDDYRHLRHDTGKKCHSDLKGLGSQP